MRPDFHFFAGKGGVGKTTCAAATAVAAASARRVLIVSTDPAHSLADAFGAARPLAKPWRVAMRRARGSLHAVELDADVALARWLRERRASLRQIVGRGTYLDDDDIDALLRLAFPGVDELIGLIELERLATSRVWDLVVVDTAPTGHTLRLLGMPATLSRIAVVLDDMQAKHRFLSESLGGRYRPDVADALVNEIAAAGRDLAAFLRDRARIRITWVLLPEVLSLAEARDGVTALDASGIYVDDVLVNRVTPPPDGPCALCEGRRAAEADVLRATHTTLAVDTAAAADAGTTARNEAGSAALGGIAVVKPRTVRVAPALEREPRGVTALRSFAKHVVELDADGHEPRARGLTFGMVTPARAPTRVRGATRTHGATATRGMTTERDAHAERWLSTVVPAGRQLVLFAGKGGVGKTTCAAAVALAVAAQPKPPRVLLLSTDPAHSLADVLDAEVGDRSASVPGAPPSLRAREIDAPALFAARRRRYLGTVDAVFDALRGGSRFDPTYDRVVVEDLIDLAPPGIDELLGILTVTDTLGLGGGPPACDLAVVDTAPTGHALRLLAMPDAALEWVHAFMAILLKYRSVMGLGELGQDLVTIARDLRGLRALLADPRRATVVAVTRAAALPRLETRRLLARLRALGIGVSAVVVNARTPAERGRSGAERGRSGPTCARCGRVADAERRVLGVLQRDVASQASRGCAIIQAPAIAPPPRGPAALAAWRRAWTS